MTDYGDENPLLMDYYGFPAETYEIKFKSRGDKALAEQIVGLYKKVCVLRPSSPLLIISPQAGQLARTTSKLEPRGEDGRGFQGPGTYFTQFMNRLFEARTLRPGPRRFCSFQHHVRQCLRPNPYSTSLNRRQYDPRIQLETWSGSEKPSRRKRSHLKWGTSYP